MCKAVEIKRKGKGQRWRVKVMQQLIEFYEMVSLNDAALRGSEKTAILKARLALNMFQRAMRDFKEASAPMPAAAEPLVMRAEAA